MKIDHPYSGCVFHGHLLDYLREVGERHQKRFGQFFTPDEVATFMVDWVLNSGVDEVFDPAFGLGAFRDAIYDRAGVQFTGCEVDATIVEFWERNTGERADFITIEDYLLAWGGQYASIVCNPPYMRFQKFLNRDIVVQEFEKKPRHKAIWIREHRFGLPTQVAFRTFRLWSIGIYHAARVLEYRIRHVGKAKTH